MSLGSNPSTKCSSELHTLFISVSLLFFHGVIGNTNAFGAFIQGSSPCGKTNIIMLGRRGTKHPAHIWKTLYIPSSIGSDPFFHRLGILVFIQRRGVRFSHGLQREILIIRASSYSSFGRAIDSKSIGSGFKSHYDSKTP